MAFTQRTLDKSVNQSRDIFDSFVYRTTDGFATVLTPGYFARSRFINEPESGWFGGIMTVVNDTDYGVFRISEDGTSVARIIIESDDFSGGSFVYSDLATQTTPINYTFGNLFIPNDELGPDTTSEFSPVDVSKVWAGNVFDFTELKPGDILGISLGLQVTTTVVNQELEIWLIVNIGPSQYNVPFHTSTYATIGVKDIKPYNEILIPDEDVINNAGIPVFTSNAALTMKVNNFVFKLVRRGQ